MEQEQKDGAAKLRLEKLIPIAVVIAFGCEPCAESAVRNAIEAGVSPHEVQKALKVIRHMKTADCFVERIGGEAVARMELPLAAASRILEETLKDSIRTKSACCESRPTCD